MALATDVGVVFHPLDVALLPAIITAGAGNDGVEVNGPIMDRLTANGPHMSGKLVFSGVTTLAASETLSVLANLQHGDNSALSDAADYLYTADGDNDGLLAATVVKTGALTAARWTVSFDVDLTMAKRYLRAQVTLTLSAGATDTVNGSGLLLVGGGHVLPSVP